MNNKNPELLAPAGTRESLYAAVIGGADAVYLGAEQFNARRGAGNFTLESLSDACDYAHLRNVKVYLTLNTLILPGELKDAVELVRQAYRAGIDAVIVQDIGAIAEIRRSIPQLPIHASTQLNTHTKAGVEALSELGVKRVTLARELSQEEIRELARTAQMHDMEVEVFVHGALCICYSGQCFMSSMIGGRSANRGLCAQACRLPYELRNKALRKPLSSPGNHLLSPKDLCLIDHLGELADCGVASFKIEGRMKSPGYVQTVTRIYKDVLTRGEDVSVTDYEKRQLAEAFSRGFTTAYYSEDRGNDIMSYGRPNNRGVFIGRVVDVQAKKTQVEIEEDTDAGDVLEFWTSKGNFTHTVCDGEAGPAGKQTFNLSKSAKKGDRVFRVRRSSLAFDANGLEPKIGISGIVSMKAGEPLTLTFTTQDDAASATFVGEGVELARTKEVTADEVREHIDRLGNTPFKLDTIDIDLDPGVGISFSTIHKARSQALDMLTDTILMPYKERVLERTAKVSASTPYVSHMCKVAAYATNPVCARAARKAGADLIYIPALNYRRGEATIAGQLSQTVEQAGYPKKSIIALPEVEHDPYDSTREGQIGFDVWANTSESKSLVVQNLGQLYRASQAGMQPEVGPCLSVLNEAAIATVAAFGATRVWLSPELSLAHIQELGSQSSLPLGITIAGSQKLMTTEHCLLMSQGPCNEDCSICPRRKSPHYLKDRKGYEFPVQTDAFGRSHIYNAVPLDISHAVHDLIRAGIDAVMVDASMMNAEETSKAVQRAVRARDIALSGDNHVAKQEGTTSGHLYRSLQ